jgi:hypothetical protein
MSWDVTLYQVHKITNCPHCGLPLPVPREEEEEVNWWNYTHNTSPMIYEALKQEGFELPEGKNWWQHLDGMNGHAGVAYLSIIIGQLELNPHHYRLMNPDNGWGDYDSLLATLCSMRDEPVNKDSRWHVSG